MDKNLEKNISKRNINVDIGDIRFNVLLDKEQYMQRLPWKKFAHMHSDYEIHFVLEGQTYLEIDGKEGLLRIGLEQDDVCIIYPENYHNPLSIGNKVAYTAVLGFSFERNPDAEKDEGFYKLFCNALNENEYCTRFNAFEFRELFKNIYENDCALPQSLQMYSLKARLTLFFLALFNGLKVGAHKPGNESADDMTGNVLRRYKIERFLTENAHTDITFTELAGFLHLSERQTNRILKEEFNLPFSKILTQMRLEKAKELLRNTDLPVKQVAEESGYESLVGFSQAMKKNAGISPTVYRILNRVSRL